MKKTKEQYREYQEEEYFLNKNYPHFIEESERPILTIQKNSHD